MQQCDKPTLTFDNIRPPPPPPPQKLLDAQNQRTQCSSSTKTFYHEVVSAVRFIANSFSAENPGSLVAVYNPVIPIIQNGRCCGIVALSMASQLIRDTPVEDILLAAKSCGFTKEGEMFSAHNMAILAENLLNCNAVVLTGLQEHKTEILNHISDGYPVLLPYDADKNHFPCVNHGLSAHWAVVTGLCFSVSGEDLPGLFAESEKIDEFPNFCIYLVKNGLLGKDLLRHAEKIYLFAHQGKSRHLAAWDLNDVIESNKKMIEVTKKYSCGDLVLPENDYLSELRNKIVLLR